MKEVIGHLNGTKESSEERLWFSRCWMLQSSSIALVALS